MGQVRGGLGDAGDAGGVVRCSILQHDFGGRVLFYHACQDKPTMHGYASPGELPNGPACLAHLAELRRRWPGRLWAEDGESAADRAAAARLRGRLFEYERGGWGGGRWLPGGRAGGAGRGPVRVRLGGAGGGAGGDRLRRPADVRGAGGGRRGLRGRWLEHDACAVVLTPLAGAGAGAQAQPAA